MLVSKVGPLSRRIGVVLVVDVIVEAPREPTIDLLQSYRLRELSCTLQLSFFIPSNQSQHKSSVTLLEQYFDLYSTR